MLIRNYSPQKPTFRITHKANDALKDSMKFSMYRSSSQVQESTSKPNDGLNKFLVNQNAQRILSPYKKSQRETLNFHNLNLLSLRNVSGQNSLFLHKTDASPPKRKYLNTEASTIRSELVIQATQRYQDDMLRELKRSNTPQGFNKSSHMRSSSLSTFKINKQESFSPLKNNSGFESSRGMMTQSTTFANTPQTARSLQMKRSESSGMKQNSDELNSQIQIKINEYDNLNIRHQELNQEKQKLAMYVDTIKKEIANEKSMIQFLKDNQTKYNREKNNNFSSNNKLGEESLHRTLEIQKLYEEYKALQEEFQQQNLNSYKSKPLKVRYISQRKTNLNRQQNNQNISTYLKQTLNKKQKKHKEQSMKDLQLQHKMMISVEKKFIDKANLQNQVIMNVNRDCLPKDFLERNNIQGDTVSSKNNIISLSQLNEDKSIMKNESIKFTPAKTSPKRNNKNVNTLQFSLDKNQTSSYDSKY